LRLRKRKARERGRAADSWFPMRFAWRRSASLSTPSLDCGLFQVFGDKDRRSFEEKHHFSRSASGRYLMLCLSECQPGDMGPRRVTQSKIRTRFDHGWRVDSIDPATIDIKSAPSFWSGCRA